MPPTGRKTEESTAMKNTLIRRSLALALLCACSAAAAPRPNILLVVSDDESPTLGVYGDANAKTPHLDRFAAGGIFFRRAYVTAPQCVQSRAAIFASRSQVGIGMSRFSAPFPAGVKTFPEVLREHGYHTGVAGRTYHQEGEGGRGDPVRQADGSVAYARFADRFDYAKSAGGGQGPGSIAQTFLQFNEFLDQVPQGKPFFLQLNFQDTHMPFDNQEIPDPADPAALTLPSWVPDTPGTRDLYAGYYNEVSRMDHSFGRVLAELGKRGLAADTLVIFIGDNGASFLRGKSTLFEGGIRVPLIAAWQGRIPAGRASDALVSAEDIGATSLDAAGLPVPLEFTGRSFLPLLLGKENPPTRDHVFAARGPHGFSPPNGLQLFDLSRTVVGNRYKLIYNPLWQIPFTFGAAPHWEEIKKAAAGLAAEGKFPQGVADYYNAPHRPLFELYDLRDDPDELTNLSGRPATAETERQLKTVLRDWMIAERDYVPLPIHQAELQQATPLERNQKIAEAWAFTPDPALPNILLLGDSNTIGYVLALRKLLAGKANVFFPLRPNTGAPDNCANTGYGLSGIDRFLTATAPEGTRWDIVHFNWGLHDCTRTESGEWKVPLGTYTNNLEQLVARLKQTPAKLIWATSSVANPGNPAVRPGDEVIYNAAALKVIERHGLPVNDIYALTQPFKPELFKAPGNIHFSPEGAALIAAQTAEILLKALPAR
jgi:arylsulfatase A-like enzyme/lysophospholipase L1-like esterase